MPVGECSVLATPGPRACVGLAAVASAPSTTCVCANLPFLGIDVAEGGGWSRMWGLAQNVGVGGLSTTCVCTNLPFLGIDVVEGGGWPRTWGLAQNVGVGPECGGWRPVNHVRMYQSPISGHAQSRRRWHQPHQQRATDRPTRVGRAAASGGTTNFAAGRTLGEAGSALPQVQRDA